MSAQKGLEPSTGAIIGKNTKKPATSDFYLHLNIIFTNILFLKMMGINNHFLPGSLRYNEIILCK